MKRELSMLKQLKLALKINDDKRYYTKDYESVKGGYSEYEDGDDFPPIKTKKSKWALMQPKKFLKIIFLLWYFCYEMLFKKELWYKQKLCALHR